MVRKKENKQQKSKDDALSFSELEEIMKYLEKESDDRIKFTFIALVYGGMRASELTHMKKDWIHIGDRESKTYGDHIQIPKKGHYCDCYDCKLQVYLDRMSKPDDVIYNKEWYTNIRKKFNPEIEKGRDWTPKTSAGARKIPIVHEVFKNILTEFFRDHNSLNRGRGWVWSQINKITKDIWGAHPEISEKTGKEIEKANRILYPHALRATTATLWSTNGMNATSLLTIMGWSSIQIAEIYVHSDETQSLKVAKEISEGRKEW